MKTRVLTSGSGRNLIGEVLAGGCHFGDTGFRTLRRGDLFFGDFGDIADLGDADDFGGDSGGGADDFGDDGARAGIVIRLG